MSCHTALSMLHPSTENGQINAINLSIKDKFSGLNKLSMKGLRHRVTMHLDEKSGDASVFSIGHCQMSHIHVHKFDVTSRTWSLVKTRMIHSLLHVLNLIMIFTVCVVTMERSTCLEERMIMVMLNH